jgi:hypothetical protein
MDSGFDPTMFDTASGRRLRKSCDGCDPGAELTFIPELMHFGFSPVGTESDWQPFIVKNTGIVPVGVEGIELIDANVDFEIENGGPVALAPGEMHTYSIRFFPKAKGTRIGYLRVKAQIVQHLPRVGLVGIGGTVAENTQGGNNGTGVPWAYRYGAFAVEKIGPNEILLDYHVSTEHRLQANFAGCRFSVGTPPAAPFQLRVLKNGVEVGTITIGTDGLVTRATANGSSVLMPVNTIVTVVAPNLTDLDIARLRMTFVGVI